MCAEKFDNSSQISMLFGKQNPQKIFGGKGEYFCAHSAVVRVNGEVLEIF